MAEFHKDLFDTQYKRLCAALERQPREKGEDGMSLTRNFAKNKTDTDRVAFVLDLDLVDQYIVFPDRRDNKSSATATRLRNDGNKAFQKKQLMDALKLYTQSVAFSPHYRDNNKQDSDLSLALANRSAVFYHLELWDDCLKDISAALQSGYPAKLRYKLYQRRGQTLARLARYHDAKEAFEAGKVAVEDSELDIKKKVAIFNDFKKDAWHNGQLQDKVDERPDPFKGICCDRLEPDLPEDWCNPTFPSLSRVCEVTYSEDRGRYLVAAEDIYPGDVVMVEKPYAAVLLPENYGTFCHQCFTHSHSLQPCHRCSQALYCSDTCRTASWDTYHQHECGMLGNLHGLGKFGQLALRCVLRDKCSDVISYRDTSHPSDTEAPPISHGCNSEGVYLSTDYHTIHSLVTHSDDRPAADIFWRTVMAVFLLKCVQKTSYFSKDERENDRDLMTYVGGLLLSHLQSFPCNAHEIAQFELDKVNLVDSQPIELGAAIYSTLSLFNHSCDPAVNRNFYGDTCVVRAIKTIRRGEEVADNYGAVYAVQPRDARRDKLRAQYYFTCGCQPCTDDWPLYPLLENVNPRWHCLQCQKEAPTDDGAIRCSTCDVTESIQDRLVAMMPAQEGYESAFEHLMTCNVDGSLPKLLQYLRSLDANLCLPWREYNNCQEAVKQCFSIMANCHIVIQ